MDENKKIRDEEETKEIKEKRKLIQGEQQESQRIKRERDGTRKETEERRGKGNGRVNVKVGTDRREKII